MVAEMKRTDRPKDWPFATALGVKLLEDGDPRGWLHIFDVVTLQEVFARVPLPDAQVAQRPCLALLRNGDPRLELAIFGETVFWQTLDRLRTQVYQTAVRGYFQAVKKDSQADSPDLDRQHEVRVRHAERSVAAQPVTRLRSGAFGRRSKSEGRRTTRRRRAGLATGCDAAFCRSGVIRRPWET